MARFLGALLAGFLLLAYALPAAAKSWRISDFSSSITVEEKGQTLVSERISVVFDGEYHGIYREIPIEYPGPRGSNYSLFLTVDRVSDADGNPLKYEISRDGAYRKIKIYIPGAVDTSKTVILVYSMPNAVRFFDDHDEFYWNVTGNDWPVPIDHVTAAVTFPQGAAGSLRAQAFTGVYGSHDQEATSNVEGPTAVFETTNPLPMRGGFTIDVYVPKGIIKPPSSLTRLVWFLSSNKILFLPVWAFGVMFAFWWVKGRDPDPGVSVAPMYEPPQQMSPAEAGTLIDDSVEPRDITSTLVDLAVRGYLKIEESQTPGLLFHSRDYVFHLLKPVTEWQGLAPFERVMLENVFQGGQECRLSSLKNQFYTAIPVIKQDLIASLRNKGMYATDPDSANAYTVVAALIVAGPFVLAQFTGKASFTDEPVPLVIAAAISVAIIFLFGRVMSCKTMLGARTRVSVLGFQEFMNRVDADRLKTLPPNTFEKYLPYAMALGVEHRWALAFAGIVKDPPSWYVGSNQGMFNPVFFSSSMRGMANDASSVFTSAPRSSSSGSGFGGGGGGGFSGGGFGGGGGGAF